ncbi:zinc finger protein 658B-like [Aricia agestis]|uniref:zinc finger protein 658B-like n=1 Tax=Aricia agestis TaxID=91739 RepID=UPI001C202C04|nr:zinc finger protein 658B-like [Aricia agestis]
MSWRARVLARRGLRRGHTSRPFSLADLADAVRGDHDENVYMDVDVFDNLVARGGPARAVINARLAPAPPLATALICLDTGSQTTFDQLSSLDLSTSPTYKGYGSQTIGLDVGSRTTFGLGAGSPTTFSLDTGSPTTFGLDAGSPTKYSLDVASQTMHMCKLRLRLETDVEPMQEISVWFDEHTLAQIDMPFLTLRNITGKNNYTCHECGAEFEHPNSLKIHLFLSCRSFEPDLFWGTIFRRLRATAPTPARLEALAAAWGRSRAGHICMYCGKLYSRKYGLKIHIRTHTGYKPLRCRHCARAFGDPSNLNKHVRLHAADAAYACALCGKRLARRRDLQRHLTSHHAS